MLNTKFGNIGPYDSDPASGHYFADFSLANIDRRLVEARQFRMSAMAHYYPRGAALGQTGLIIAAVFCFILSFGDFAPIILRVVPQPCQS